MPADLTACAPEKGEGGTRDVAASVEDGSPANFTRGNPRIILIVTFAHPGLKGEPICHDPRGSPQ
jgi:hypothetical protein